MRCPRNPVCRQVLSFLCLLAVGGCSGIHLERPLKQLPSDWPMFARVPERTNTTSENVSPPLVLAWQQDVSAGIGNGSPLVVDSFLIIGNMRGELHAINAYTGKRLGWANIGEAILGAPVIVGSTAIVAASHTSESLSAFDLSEGRMKWRRSYGDIEASPLLLVNYVYIANTSGAVYCVDRYTGDMIWQYEMPQNTRRKGFRSTPATDGNVVVIGGDDGILYALDAITGKIRWTTETHASIIAPVAIGNGMAFVGNRGGVCTAVQLDSGRQAWTFSTEGTIYGGPCVDSSSVFIGTSRGYLYSLSTRDGILRWKTDLGGVVNSSPVASGSVLYVGTLAKQLCAVDRASGALMWTQDVPGRIKTSPIIVNRTLYIATDEREVMAFREATQ